MNERQYLIEVLLRAKESISSVAQKAAKGLDELTKAQDNMGESAKRSRADVAKQISTLEQLITAHIREKKALEESSAVFKFRADLRRQEANADRKRLEDLRKQAAIEKSLASERKRQGDEAIASLQKQIAERDAARASQVASFKLETDGLRRQAALIESLGKESSAANRRRAAERDLEIAEILATISQLEDAQKKAARAQVKDLRDTSRLEKAIAGEREKRDLEEIRALRLLAAEREEAGAAQDDLHEQETANLREQLELERTANNQRVSNSRARAAQTKIEIAEITQQSAERRRAAEDAEKLARREASAFDKVTKSITTQTAQLERLRKRYSDNEKAGNRLSQTMNRLGLSGENAAHNLRGLNAEMQGLAIAFVIKYAQSLITVLAGLAAQLFAVAAAAGQAAVSLAAALGAGMAQAIPVVGVLAASFARLGSILKAVKQQNDQQLKAGHDATGAARKQSSAAEMIRAAQERVADAHRRTAEAQRELTDARRDAIRTVEDLVEAERQARLNLERSQRGLRSAVEGGDVLGAADAFEEVRTARRGVTRAREDAAPVRARGVAAVDGVIQAQERLTDARRQEARANEDLARTRVQAAETLGAETAAVDELQARLAQLSPAEQELYRRILALQEVYRRVSRPITDIIVSAYTDAVNRVIVLLQDPRILGGFRSIAVEVAKSVRRGTREGSNEDSIGAFQALSGEATRNIPVVTDIAVNLFKALRSTVIAALPSFRLLLRYTKDYTGQLREFTGRKSKALRDFFLEGIEAANAFFKLGLSVVRLFLALAGPGGGAEEGVQTVNDLTDMVDGLTEKVKDNAGAVREFFEGSRSVLWDVLSVIGTIGEAMLEVFNPKSSSELAEFFNLVLIPALADVVEILGGLVTLFHQLFTLPGFAEFARFAATILILFKGMTVIRLAVLDLLTIIPTFLRAFGLMLTASEAAAAGLAGLGAITPLGWVVLAIAAIVAAIVLLDKKLHFLGPTWEWIQEAAVDAFEWIKFAAGEVVDWFKDVWNQGILKWVRWPLEHIQWPIFKWLINAAIDVIQFFKEKFSQDSGPWHDVWQAIITPVKGTLKVVKFVFDQLKTIVDLLLDVLAGRFDEVESEFRHFFTNIADIFTGAFTTMLGVWEKLLEALGKVPGFGGPFAEAAEQIKEARESIDEWRDSLRRSDKEQGTANERVEKARENYKKAKDELVKTKAGTDDYRDAVKKARDAQDKYNDEIRRTGSRARSARGPVKTLKDNIDGLTGVSSDAAEVIAADLNAVLEELGAKKINVKIKRRKRTAAQEITGSDNPLLGPVFGERAVGGIANPWSASSADDHLLIDPMGRPVAAMSGTEGVINAPQMGVINQALGIAQQVAGMPWGSLDSLWGSGMRHYARGGGLPRYAKGGKWNPLALARQISSRGPYQLGENATLGDNPRPGAHAAKGWHYRLGNSGAIDVNADGAPGGEARWLDSLATWLRTKGYHVLWRTAGHFDHLHVDASGGGGSSGSLARLSTPQVIGGAGTVARRVALSSASRLTKAANRYIDRQTLSMGDTGATAASANANVVYSFRQAIRRLNSSPKERLALWMAGIVESGLRNLRYGDADSLGALQERVSIYGRAHALSPFASATRFLRDAKARRPWRSTAGSLAQSVQRSKYPGRYDAVRGQALRYMRGGGRLARANTGLNLGPAKGIAAPESSMPKISATWLTVGISTAMAGFNSALSEVNAVLARVAAPALKRSKNLALRLERAFDRLTGDNGLLDQMHNAVTAIGNRAALALQTRQFSVGPGGPQRSFMTGAELSKANLQTLQAQRGALGDERGAISTGIEDAEAAIRRAQKSKNKKAEAIARAALTNLKGRLDQNTADMAQNAQDQVEAMESFQQELLNQVNDNAERYNSSLDRWTRTAKALGVSVDPNKVLDMQVGNMQTQISGLQGVLAEAMRTGNFELATQVRGQIDELNVSITEATAQRFQNSIDAVNAEAQKANTKLDRRARRAQIGGRTDFAAMQSVLNDRLTVQATQRAGLVALQQQAAMSGNVEQLDNLTDQIEELDVSIAENTQATKDNTNAAFAAKTEDINSAFGFTSGVMTGVQGFFQAISEATGIDTTPQQLAALLGVGTALGTQQSGLLGQLGKLTGQDLTGLSGTDLINYLLSISTGPAFEAIMATLDPTQQAAFKDLITALIGNATAVEQNTQAVNNLTNPQAQSFSSSFWTAFRTAVFTGEGGLLPQFAATVPSAAVGAKVLQSGMLMVHAGETVRPATINRDWRGGDSYELNVTTPTQVLDPVDVNRQLAFLRKTSGR